MRRRYTFVGDEVGAQRFNLVWSAVTTRGTPRLDHQGQLPRVTKEQHRSDAKIIKALKAISVPKGADPEPGRPDTRERTLKPEGGSIELEQSDYKRLQDYVDETQWQTTVVDLAVELQDSLEVDATKITDEPTKTSEERSA